MKSSRKIVILFALLLFISCNLMGCGSAEPTLSDKTFLPSEEFVKTLGRTYFTDDTLWLPHTASGAEFTVTGTKVSITIQADSSYSVYADGQARVAVYVNDERVADEMINEQEKTLTVFENTEESEKLVRIVKLSEAAHSTCGISKINVTSRGDIKPTEAKERYIEFIGDSITCGYGVDDEVKEHHFSTTTEDGTKTYAYKTAANLNADYSMVSFSGYGVISGYSVDGQKSAGQLVPTYYDKLGFSYNTYMNHSPQDITWDFSKRQPDVIVINLGTNDNSYVQGAEDKKADFISGYVDFLKKIHENNPDATIICTLGIMGGDLYPAVEDAVEKYTAETGKSNVHAVKLFTQKSSDGYAADWHPTEATHEKAAKRLTERIIEIMGW